MPDSSASSIQSSQTAAQSIGQRAMCSGGEQLVVEGSWTVDDSTGAGRDHDQFPVGGAPFHFNLLNRSEHTARAIYTIEVVTDRGRPVYEVKESALVALPASSTTSREETVLRNDLEDGYYFVRATVAAITDNGEESTGYSHLYVRVAAGMFTVLSYNEWYQISHANEAIQL